MPQLGSAPGVALIGRNRVFNDALHYASMAARHACPLLIVGETGTGKDQVARMVHGLSPRASGPFVSLNCAALPESLIESELFGYERGAFTGAARSYLGRFAAADGGTLFLDELGDLPLASQAKLLRAIENREVTPLGSTRPRQVDMRIVAATHQPLETMVRERRFRPDLFYRLNVARVRLPPLRERRDDILELAAHFMKPLRHTREGARVGWFDAGALQRLLAHPWPGNVRELRNVIESIFIDPPDGAITERSLPSYLTHPEFWDGQGQADAAEPVLDERQRILQTLSDTHWNKAAAARNLQWSRVTLYRKMARLEIPNGGH
ncbi:sigma 54-interacting transcriptional regulator [Ramlibacter sp. 2FC]|uniref:sigma-54 interaction domain-containing protein n=1 Tax=Ramlibacter sp. 2FC TaxID=2502188 RepID=UPI0010F77F1F|nr:sigma 54-interacting transcriptional regulator [Ramlibacter sp. 2FC]